MIALALIFATSFEPAGEHRIEILTETRVIAAEACSPQYLVGMSGGVVVGSCSTIEDRARPTASETAGGPYTVQLRQGQTLESCLLVQVRRSLLPRPQTLMSFECTESEKSAD